MFASREVSVIGQERRSVVSLMSRLRDATADAHQRTEASVGFSHIQHGTLTTGIFSARLHRLQALYVPAERAIVAFLARAATPYVYHAKALLLYVLEGVTLGGKILQRAAQVFTWFGAGLDGDP